MDLIIHHTNCPDGYGCAWLHSLLFPDSHRAIGAAPHSISKKVNDLLSRPNFYPDSIHICDIGMDWALPCAQKLLETIKDSTVTIVDHHSYMPSTEDALHYVKHRFRGRFKYITNKSKSSTFLFYRHFIPPEMLEPDNLVYYINDYDTNSFTMPYSMEVSLFLKYGVGDFEPRVYSSLNEELKNLSPHNFIVRRGREFEQDISSYARRKLKKVNYLLLLNNIVPAIETKKYKGEVCNMLQEEYSGVAPFSATYHYSGDEVIVSLRSKGNYEVNKIAQKFGGGGHKYASAFHVKRDVFRRKILLSDDDVPDHLL